MNEGNLRFPSRERSCTSFIPIVFQESESEACVTVSHLMTMGRAWIQDPKLHKRYFAGYTGTANSLKTCLVRKQVTFEHPMLL